MQNLKHCCEVCSPFEKWRPFCVFASALEKQVEHDGLRHLSAWLLLATATRLLQFDGTAQKRAIPVKLSFPVTSERFPVRRKMTSKFAIFK